MQAVSLREGVSGADISARRHPSVLSGQTHHQYNTNIVSKDSNAADE